ncbi:anti-sigma factor family protein [Streptomyces odontomachi]|uniref:anti-sigma factor family protein n=1 Tax=Streptomyces odontomachi TaxID=2944940 RepID=UPI00210BA938|nr:zf-HC2 domain-containing protein [Streptomyces sp. ODS25]
MSGSQPTPVEQHLGDRLAALVDGELGHDARERVLAHLATCPKCKAEADAQRRLKSVFAETAPPPPSASLLARLQGLPAGDGDAGDDSDPFRGEGLGGTGVFRMTGDAAARLPLRPKPRAPFGYGPSGPHTPVLPDSERGFRIHDVSRQEAERSAASRGRRFAFVAAGAVSLAAMALGGLSTGVPTAAGSTGGAVPSNATPLRTVGPAAAADAARRRNGTSVARSADSRGTLPQSVTPIAANAPLLPSVPTPHGGAAASSEIPVTSFGAAPYAPLIQATPTSTSTPYASWVTDTATP